MKIAIFIGTRPEAIKMIPIILAAPKHNIDTIVINTGQHGDLIYPILDLYDIKTNYDLSVMTDNQTLSGLTSSLLSKLSQIIDDYDIGIVEGDTTTAFSCALNCYYNKKKIAHIEAGLRTGNLYSPFPEEGNRKLISHIANYHFAPTATSRANLINEGIINDIYVVGNTSIDMLRLETHRQMFKYDKMFDYFRSIEVNIDKKYVLLTIHRRENISHLNNIINAMARIVNLYPDLNFILPLHPNPNLQPLCELTKFKNFKIIKPQTYDKFVALMYNCHMVITDSGGIQEEAPFLSKPVMVLRDTTERQEALSDSVVLAGIDIDKIVSTFSELYHMHIPHASHVYGDGYSADCIVSILGEK